MDVRDLFYHGVRQQVARVLTAMGPERVEKGLEAFTDGASSWAECFFAQAYPDLRLNDNSYIDGFGNWSPEFKIAAALGMGRNTVPMRIVYRIFDGVGQHGFTMTKDDLRKYIQGFLAENSVAPEVNEAINALIASTKLSDVDTEAVWQVKQ